MIVGVPKEIKVREYRVGMVPGAVKSLVDAGHQVLVEAGAGVGSGPPGPVATSIGTAIVKPICESGQRRPGTADPRALG